MIILLIFFLVLILLAIVLIFPNLNRAILIGSLIVISGILLIYLVRSGNVSSPQERLLTIRNQNLGQESINQLTLTLDHINHPDRQCYECMTKHLVLAEALIELETSKSMNEEIGQIASDIRLIIIELRQKGAQPEIARRIENVIERISHLKPSKSAKPDLKRQLLPLRNTFFNLREIVKQIELIEHSIAMRYSREQILNTIQFAISLAQEGATMSTDEREAYLNVEKWFKEEIEKIEKNKETISPEISQDFRRFRKEINSFYPSLHEKALFGDDAKEPPFKSQCSTTCQEK